jgi:hypothetical protein
MRLVRILLGSVGVATVLIGVHDLLTLGWSSVWSTVEWLVLGNVLHDAGLVPIVLVLGVILVPLVPTWARMPVVTGFVVLGSVTLVAVPVLGDFGNEVSNPSLMPRDYGAGWMTLVGLVGLGVVCGCWWSRRRTRGLPAAAPPVPAKNPDGTTQRRTVKHEPGGSDGV